MIAIGAIEKSLQHSDGPQNHQNTTSIQARKIIKGGRFLGEGRRLDFMSTVFEYATAMSLRGPGLSIYDRGRKPSFLYQKHYERSVLSQKFICAN